MKTRVPENWKTNTEYSFRFHSYDNINNSSNERWWAFNKHGIAWTTCENDVNLDMKEIIKFANRRHISINKILSDIISHEIIHSILTRDINNDVSYKFDNICSKKNIKFETWFGGMP